VTAVSISGAARNCPDSDYGTGVRIARSLLLSGNSGEGGCCLPPSHRIQELQNELMKHCATVEIAGFFARLRHDRLS